MLALMPLAKTVLPGIALAAVVGIGVYVLQERGREAERKVCHARETAAALTYQQNLNEKQRELARREAEHLAVLADVERSKNEEIKKLSADIDRLGSRGLYVAAPRCPSQTGSGLPEAGDSGAPGSASDRIRLSEEDERSLISIASDAQRVVQQYDACRRTLSNLAVIQ
jgi:hypothetical protein